MKTQMHAFVKIPQCRRVETRNQMKEVVATVYTMLMRLYAVQWMFPHIHNPNI